MSRKRCKIEGKLALITNRKSYMSFRLVSKSLITEFGSSRGVLRKRNVVEDVVVKKFTFAISSLDELLM